MELDDALNELLPDRGEGNETAILIAAAREAWRRRHINTLAGGATLAALYEQGLSWREIEEVTGIPKDTARRWSTPPGEQPATD